MRMGRPREFDSDIAVQGAMEIFWRQGYLNTNLPDLLTAMGLTRGSFYKAYKDKETAYLAALDRYEEVVVSKAVEMLNTCDTPDVVACLSQLISPDKDPRLGCFICNAMVELAPDNPTVADKANAMAARLRDAIFNALERYGVPGPSGDMAKTADLILHLYFGYQAVGKSGGASSSWTENLQELLGTASG